MKKWRKGIRRIVILISIFAFFYGALVAGDGCEFDYPWYLLAGVLYGCFCFFVVWICYFVAFWIIKGFSEEKTIQKIKQK